ncbi:MAG: protoglobin domain-containing protein [Pseudolabrys sp.]
MFDRLLEFVEVDDEARALASRLCDLLAPQLTHVIDDFYAKVAHFNISPHITPQTIANLKRRQKQHWMALLRSRFDEEYFESIRRIGVRHRDIDLSPMWYVAGYMRLKLAFVEIIIKSELPAVTKGQLVKTLDKYIAIDMALALSTYEAVVLD